MNDARAMLPDTAGILDARGLIVWLWDSAAGHLAPTLVHGYAERVVAQLPMVRWDDDNATAAAFRTGQTRVLGDSNGGQAALVVPLLTPAGCAGVLAVELQRGKEPTRSGIAVATILGAQLAQLADRMHRAQELSLSRVAVGGIARSV
jgi:hypothetical protein